MTHSDTASPSDLAGAVFVALTEHFFDEHGEPIPFGALRLKGGTQDDPFDEYVGKVLAGALPDDVAVLRSGKLVSPDMVVARPGAYQLLMEGGADFDTRSIIAIEVKKVNPDKKGRPARASGMDYNSTPPSEIVRVYTEEDAEIWVPAFYLFALLGQDERGTYVDSLALVPGAALNKDTGLYKRVTGERLKLIGLGSYGDGADRQRPMLVFSNPLGWPWMQRQATLVSERDDLVADRPTLAHVREFTRTLASAADAEIRSERFHCYRLAKWSPACEAPEKDPIPTPKDRSEKTTPRGRFKITFPSEKLF